MKTSGDKDFVGSANERLVSTLTENLSNMENSSRRDAVSPVISYLKEETV